MIDESMDTEQMKQPAQPWEFRSKPAWQRLIIMIGGVTVNVVLAYFIYAMMLFAWGKQYIPNENLSYGVYADSLMVDMGFSHGDQIISVDGKRPKTVSDVSQYILFDEGREVLIRRDGAEQTITLPAAFDQDLLKRSSKSTGVFQERFPAVVDTVLAESFAEKAGLEKGDKLLAVGNEEAAYMPDFIYALAPYKGKKVDISFERNGERITRTAEISEDGKLGFGYKSPLEFLESERLTYGFFESIPAGIAEGNSRLVDYVKSLKLLFSSEGAKQVGGFITIGKLFGNQWDWVRFWNMTALLSIILAVMNILPIPALDGGHVMFLLYEMVAGRQPNQKFMEYAQLVGIAILITLLLYANGMDVFRVITGN